MPDEPNGQPSPDGGEAPSDDTQRLGPDLTKHVPVEPSPYDTTHPWSGPAPSAPQPGPPQAGPAQPQPPSGQVPPQPYPPAGYPQYHQTPPPQQYAQQEGYPQQPYGQQGYPPAAYGQPYGASGYAGYGGAAPASSSKAVAVLVLGIASLLLLLMCGLGLVTAIIALALAPGAKREIRDSQGRYTGLGMVQAGVITSWVSIGLAVLAVGAWIALMAVGGSIGSDLDYSNI